MMIVFLGGVLGGVKLESFCSGITGLPVSIFFGLLLVLVFCSCSSFNYSFV